MPALHRRTAIAAGCFLLLAATTTAAAEDDHRVIVVGDRGQNLTIELDGTELTIVTEGDDGTCVRIVDMEQVGLLLQDGLQGAFAALRDLQLDMHMGRDNRLEFSHGDETVEVDVDAILGEVQRALRTGLADLDTDTWTGVHDRDRSDEELRAELRALQREVKQLQRELAKEGI